MTNLYFRRNSPSMLRLIVVVLVSSTSTLNGQESASGVAPSVTSEKVQTAESQKSNRTLDDLRRTMRTKEGMGGMDMSLSGRGMSGRGMGGMGMGGMGMGGMGMGGMEGPTEKQLLAQLIQRLYDRLNSPTHKRETVEKQLRSALQQFFDADMEERVKEFDKVKARLAEMELKLQRRLNSDQEIVELQLKKMLHKADGLDFSIPSEQGYGYTPNGMSGYGEGLGMPGLGGGPGAWGGEMGYGTGGLGSMGSGMDGSGGANYDAGSTDPNAQSIGYDSSFGLTRVQRLEHEDLENLDPLKSYAQAMKISSETDRTKEATLSNSDKLKSILLSFHQFSNRFHHLPRSVNRHAKNQPPHSWRVAILPLVGYADLYREYKFDQPWDSPDNMEVASKMPEIYRSARSKSKDSTPFQMLVGEGAFDSSITPPRFADITDGSSNTIALVESDTEVVWTKPEDVEYHINGILRLSESRLVGFADGHTRVLPSNLDTQQLHALISRAGGEVVELPKP